MFVGNLYCHLFTSCQFFYSGLVHFDSFTLSFFKLLEGFYVFCLFSSCSNDFFIFFSSILDFFLSFLLTPHIIIIIIIISSSSSSSSSSGGGCIISIISIFFLLRFYDKFLFFSRLSPQNLPGLVTVSIR